jgi:hypothetical protein
MQVPPIAYQFKAAGRAALAGQPTQLSAAVRVTRVLRHLGQAGAAVAVVQMRPTITGTAALAVHRVTSRAALPGQMPEL